MKKTILLLSFFIALQLQAQINWELTWESDSLAIWPAGLAQINDSSYLTFSNVSNVNQGFGYSRDIVIIDQNGHVRDSLITYPPFQAPKQIFNLKGEKFLTVTGVTDSLSQKKFEFCKFDSELNILWHKSYSVPEDLLNPSFYSFCEEDTDSNIVIASFITKNDYSKDVMVFKLSQTGDSLLTKYLYNEHVSEFKSFISTNDSTYILLGMPIENGGLNNILEFDQNFDLRYEINPDLILGNSELFFYANNLLKYSEDSILVMRNTDNIDNVELSYLDEQYNLIDSTSIHQAQSSVFFNEFYHLVLSQDKNIYITYECGVLGRTIIKLDAGLNEIWRLYLSLSDPLYYTLMNIIPTLDDGLLLNFMASYNLNEMKTHFLKIGPNGEIPTGFSNPEIQISNYKVYPNPGQIRLNIAVGRDFKSGQVQLFNLMGQKILEQKFNGFESQVNTEHLITGVYTYQILEDGMLVHSGKWIKK